MASGKPDLDQQSTRKLRKPRSRRASASGSGANQKPRDRTVWEVIQMTVLLEEASMLGDLKPNEDGYEEIASMELAVKLQISVVGAKKILKLKKVVSNDDVWQFLKKHSMLGVFADCHFTKAYSSIKSGGGTLSMEFLDAFMNGTDANLHERNLTQRARTRKLDGLALSVSAEGRDLLVSIFFTLVAPIATLCSFVSPGTSLDKIKLLDIIGRYLGDKWTSWSLHREYQTQANGMHLVDGWNMVNEAMKIQVQELGFQKQVKLQQCDESRTNNMRGEESWKISAEEVRESLFEICCRVIVEFFAWCFQFVMKDEEAEQFMSSVLETMDNICAKVSEELGVTAAEGDEISEEFVRACFQSVADGHPTLAEIKYDSKELIPSKREARLNATKRDIIWKPNDIIMRCRWESSPAREVYSSYISKSRVEEFKVPRSEEEEIPPVHKPPLDVERASSQSRFTDLSVPGTPQAKVSKRTYNDVIKERRGASEEVEWRVKRAKLVLLQNSRRLYDEAIRERIERGKRLKIGYVEDGEASGDELTHEEDEKDIERTDEEMLHATNLSVQLLYETILDWPVLPVPLQEIEKDRHRLQPPFDANNPETKAERSAVSDLLSGDVRWAKLHCQTRSRSFLPDVTQARAVEAFSGHWRNIIPIEIRAMVSDAIGDLLPKTRDNPAVPWTQDIPKEDFVLLRAHSVSHEKGVFNVTCNSLQPSLNKEIAMKLQGGSICVGYVEGERSIKEKTGIRRKAKLFSNPILFICRRVHWENDDVLPLGDMHVVEELKIHLALGRERTRNIHGIWQEDLFRIIPICPLAPHLRMFKAVHVTYRLPEKLRNIIFGEDCPKVPSHSDLEKRVDPGCEQYLQRVRETTPLIDDTQLASLRMVLGSVGKGEPYSSSLSLIQGPPGTGKTTMLIVLIGAFLHHSICGHIGRAQIDMLKDKVPSDAILRHSANKNAFRILVCCGSNQAVDNILQSIHDHGIPDGEGGRISPQCVRLAKQGHDYRGLKEYSMDVKALPFDTFLYNMNQPRRKCASSKARKSFAKEVIIAFATNSSCGGARVKNLKASWDIILQDEACQSWEPEALIPITAAMKQTVLHRCHVVCCGDPEQLSPMFHAEMLMKKANKDFDYALHMKSLFERLQDTKRAPFLMLTNQYRMHPIISNMHSGIFYNGLVRSPLPASSFQEPYNLGWKESTGGFAPVTLIDTSKLPTRFENNDQKGSVSNCVEVDLIDGVLDDIKRLAGVRFPSLRNQIAVLVPYRAQVNRAKNVLESYGKYRQNGGVSRQGFQILVGTVDAMQGEQRDIIIFGATRSNQEQCLGFVDSPNRLNVAVSRASKLLVIIADMSTVGGCDQFKRFRDYVAPADNGGALIIRQE